MSTTLRRVSYFTTTAIDRPGSAYQVLDELARAEIDLLAFSCVPTGPSNVQLTLYPSDPDRLRDKAPAMRLVLMPAQEAILVQGDDEIGALTEVHRKLYDAQISVYASNGVSGSQGHFGYLVHVRPDDVDRACNALGI